MDEDLNYRQSCSFRKKKKKIIDMQIWWQTSLTRHPRLCVCVCVCFDAHALPLVDSQMQGEHGNLLTSFFILPFRP